MSITRGLAALVFFWSFLLLGYFTPSWAVNFAFAVLLVLCSVGIFIFASHK